MSLEKLSELLQDEAEWADRLQGLAPADMPWLRKDVDLTPPDGGPEVCGSPMWHSSVSEARRQRRQAFEIARAAKQEARELLRIVPRVFRSKYSPNECQRDGRR